MPSTDSPSASTKRWTSLWVAALLSLLAQLWICQFFSFGQMVPGTIDINPSNLWKFQYHFPPTGTFEVLNWLGVAYLPQSLNPFTIAAHLAPWTFFTCYAPVMATLSLLAMAAFLRELECPRPAALFGGLAYAWQGDLLPFVFPAHFGYITTWPFFAIAAWGALRAQRTRHWAYAVISGAGCGLMIELQPDRGAIASLLIAVLFLAPVLSRMLKGDAFRAVLSHIGHLALCAAVALCISLAAFLSLFQSNIVGVKLGGHTDREQTYKFVTQFSLGPAETLTYLVPGFFGWHVSNGDGPYWGWIGEWPDWPKNHQGQRNLNLAISTTGTVATVLALIGICTLLPGPLARMLGRNWMSERQIFFGRVLLVMGAITLVLSWGWHTPFYRPLFELPLMDKWRNPLKWLEMTNFALVALSAVGVQHLLASLDAEVRGVKTIRHRLFWFTSGMLALLALGLVGSYPFSIVLASALNAENYSPYAIANIMGTVHHTMLIAVVLMGFFCLFLYGAWQPDRLRQFTLPNPLLQRVWQKMLTPDCLPVSLVACLGVLSVLQLGWVATQFLQPTELALMTSTNPLLEKLVSENKDNAVRVSVATEDPLLNVLLLDQFAALRISCLDISAASRLPDDINTFLGTLDNSRGRMWFLAGVKNVVMPQSYVAEMRLDPVISANIDHVDGYTLQQTSSPDLPSHALVALRNYLDKATLVPNTESFATEREMLKRLKDPAWNPRDSILLSSAQTTPPAQPLAAPTTTDSVELKTYTPTEIDIVVNSARGGYVLVNDQYDPDWQAQVNGVKAPVLRADFIMRAVAVGPGTSVITMRYIAHYRIGEMLRQMAHLNLGDLTFSARAVTNFSDAAMLAAWIVAGLALWQPREKEPES